MLFSSSNVGPFGIVRIDHPRCLALHGTSYRIPEVNHGMPGDCPREAQKESTPLDSSCDIPLQHGMPVDHLLAFQIMIPHTCMIISTEIRFIGIIFSHGLGLWVGRSCHSVVSVAGQVTVKDREKLLWLRCTRFLAQYQRTSQITVL